MRTREQRKVFPGREERTSVMKRKFACEVDCAACAAKLEDAIKKVDGVENATVSFITQKLTLEAAEDRFDEILKEVVRVAKKVEPDTVITI